MKLDSKLFDGIRIRSRREEKPQVEAPACAWDGCDQPGIYKAPKGNRNEGEYHNFCLEHVRHYNTTFNFFSGMAPEDIETHVHESATTAGRPTWDASAKPQPRTNPNGPKMYRQPRPNENARRVNDPLHIFARYERSQARNPQQERERKLHELDRRALETLGFQRFATSAEIKSAYKALVKIHHPDANGGDKSSEERLRAIIAAYTHLKQKGFVQA
ncbi:MAG TPA: DnaJ domain-containing protein [Devosiaceae bacterium]|nr:DnaJ domain-containing protein [Devosiaceae bacterium]